jgi:hypothetical protein
MLKLGVKERLMGKMKIVKKVWNNRITIIKNLTTLKK